MITMYEWTGSILGLMGAFLLALNKPGVARFGWLGFLLVNVAMILFVISIERNCLSIQQCGFTSVLGFLRNQC